MTLGLGVIEDDSGAVDAGSIAPLPTSTVETRLAPAAAAVKVTVADGAV